MKAIKFTYVDILKSKSQLYLVILLLGVIGPWMTFNNPLLGIYYTSFGALVIGIQPFMQEQTAETGFINMLPGIRKNRVAGRYLYGLFLQIISLVFLGVSLTVYTNFHKAPVYMIGGVLISFGVSLLFCSLQYMLFYALGKMKSQQVASIVMMLPGFLMFFGVSYATEYISKHVAITPQWLLENEFTIGISVALFGLVFWLLGIWIANIITRKKDYM